MKKGLLIPLSLLSGAFVACHVVTFVRWTNTFAFCNSQLGGEFVWEALHPHLFWDIGLVVVSLICIVLMFMLALRVPRPPK